MSEDNKSALVPRLRFPEFREAWVSSPMSKLYSFKGNNSLSRDKLNYEGGSLRNIHYGDIHTKFALHFRADAEPVPYINDGESHSTIRPENYCMAGDMVFADASEDMADIGKAIEIIDTGNAPLVSGLHTILARPNEGSFALGFGAYLFSSEGVRKQIQREGQGAKVLGLSATRLGNVQLHYPGKPKEQKKIAGCLSSLDELITAETLALTALKTHKKGLMQQLFPREGETVPRLRFPEFREAREWKEVALGDVCERIMDGTHFSPASKSGPFLYLTSKNVRPGALVLDDVSYISDDEHRSIFARCPVKKNDLLLTKDGASTGNCTLNPLDFEFSLLSSVAVIRGHHEKILQEFLAQDFQSRHVQDQIADAISGQAITRITLEKIKLFKVWITSSHEQQRISDCLASLDELVTAQSQKIDALKTHKKSLMQQLFPVLDEVQA